MDSLTLHPQPHSRSLPLTTLSSPICSPSMLSSPFILSTSAPPHHHFSLTFVCWVLLHPCSSLTGSRPHPHLSPSPCLSPPYRVLLILISSITFMPSPSVPTHCCLYLLTLLIPFTPPRLSTWAHLPTIHATISLLYPYCLHPH